MKKNYLILCVDDNKNNLFTLDALLQQLESIETILVDSGREALNVLLKRDVDLIILDIQMPEMDGFEVARLIKLNNQTSDIPILFLTAVYKSQEFVEQGYELGAVDYLTKPIDDHLLLNKINLYLSMFRQRDEMLREHSRFQHLAHSIAEGIFVLNNQQHLVYINPKALELLGYEEYELMDKNIHNMIHYHDLYGKPVSSEQCPVHHALITHQSYMNNNEQFIRKDGTAFPVSIAAAPIEENVDDYSVVVIFKDLTQIKQQEAQVKALLKVEQQHLIENEAIIDSLVKMIDQRDSYTAGHTQRVAHYCVLIAREMHYSTEEVSLLEKAAKLHDIGKIATPDSILLKPGRLSELEYSLIQEHLNAGYSILKDVPNYHELAEIMRSHHERFDGKGYPEGIAGYIIPPLSRIMIVADAFDAMTTNRIYKPRMAVSDALNELRSLKEIQFHPEVVDAAVQVLAKVSIQTDISQNPNTILEQERFAYFFRDRLTGLYSLDYLPILLREKYSDIKKYFLLFRLKNFSDYNQLYGWNKGDIFLQKIAGCLNEYADPDTIVFRVHGDDFLFVSHQPIKREQKYVHKIIAETNGVVQQESLTYESEKEDDELQSELEQFITG